MAEFRARFEKMMKEQQQIRTTATEKITEVLTSEQKTAFDTMQGKSFDLSSLRPGPMPGSQNRTTRPSTRTRSQTKQRARRNANQGSGDDQPQ